LAGVRFVNFLKVDKSVEMLGYKVILEFMNETPGFIADLHYFTTEQGGRKTPAFTNYFPQVKFGFSKNQGGGRQNFINKEVVNPGEDVIAEITLLDCQFCNNKLKTGLTFDIMEGPHIVGTGIIIEILNQELLAL
jgi:translation elongation factor EF-Tu-like GTPase